MLWFTKSTPLTTEDHAGQPWLPPATEAKELSLNNNNPKNCSWTQKEKRKFARAHKLDLKKSDKV